MLDFKDIFTIVYCIIELILYSMGHHCCNVVLYVVSEEVIIFDDGGSRF